MVTDMTRSGVFWVTVDCAGVGEPGMASLWYGDEPAWDRGLHMYVGVGSGNLFSELLCTVSMPDVLAQDKDDRVAWQQKALCMDNTTCREWMCYVPRLTFTPIGENNNGG